MQVSVRIESPKYACIAYLVNLIQSTADDGHNSMVILRKNQKKNSMIWNFLKGEPNSYFVSLAVLTCIVKFGIAWSFLKYPSHSVLGSIFNVPAQMKVPLVQVNDSQKQATRITWCMCLITYMLSCRQSSVAFVFRCRSEI